MFSKAVFLPDIKVKNLHTGPQARLNGVYSLLYTESIPDLQVNWLYNGALWRILMYVQISLCLFQIYTKLNVKLLYRDEKQRYIWSCEDIYDSCSAFYAIQICKYPTNFLLPFFGLFIFLFSVIASFNPFNTTAFK